MEPETKRAYATLHERRGRMGRLMDMGVLDVGLIETVGPEMGVPVEEEVGKKEKYHYVYVFRCQGKYKIGRSVDPEWRLRQLQTGSAETIEMIHLIKTKNHGLERAIHRKFNEKRENGEWFGLSGEDLDWIKGFGDSLG